MYPDKSNESTTKSELGNKPKKGSRRTPRKTSRDIPKGTQGDTPRNASKEELKSHLQRDIPTDPLHGDQLKKNDPRRRGALSPSHKDPEKTSLLANKRLLRVPDVADLLNCSIRKVFTLLADKKLMPIRIDRLTRIHPDELNRLIEENQEHHHGAA